MANRKNDIVIVSAVRTPFGKYCGALQSIDFYDLGAIPIRETLQRVNVPGQTVGEVFWGCCDSAVCKDLLSPIAARQSLLKAGLPSETASISLDMAGVSGLHALKLAVTTMRLGEIDCAIAGGATSISREPLIVRRDCSGDLSLGKVETEDPLLSPCYKDFKPLAVDCDNVATEYGIERIEQDEWALRSHVNYGKAWNAGYFKEEILPLSVTRNGLFISLDIDEGYNPQITSLELARSKSKDKTQSITAGNSAAMSDGAGAVLLMTRGKAIEIGLQPLATVIANVSLAINPYRMPEAPGYAFQMVSKKAGLTPDDIDIIEINEDFACVPLVALRIVAGDNRQKLEQLQNMTNVNGGAIAIGHPGAVSGARIIMSLMHELRRRGGGYGLGAIAGGLAQADACIIKVD